MQVFVLCTVFCTPKAHDAPAAIIESRSRNACAVGSRRVKGAMASVDTSNPATDRHFKTGHHDDGLRLVIGSA